MFAMRDCLLPCFEVATHPILLFNIMALKNVLCSPKKCCYVAREKRVRFI